MGKAPGSLAMFRPQVLFYFLLTHTLSIYGYLFLSRKGVLPSVVKLRDRSSEGELGRVEAVRSPYSGMVKKVKVKGATGNQMEVEVTVVPIAN
jgi:hypothetical protein